MQASTQEPIGLLAAAVRRSIQAAVLRRVEGLGLSTLQFWTLVGIAERPTSCQAELAAHLRMDDPTASRVLRTLRSRGWVRARRGRSDRRRMLVELTPAGEQLVARLLPIARSIRNAVESVLDPEEREQTRAALRKIVARMQELAAGPAVELTA
jgi:DNA-binding MarR family transcriptional regulator